MMKVFKRKQTVALVMLLVLLLVLTGCRQAPDPGPEEVVETPEVEMPEVEEEEEVQEMEEEQEQDENGTEDQLMEADGKYVGFADSHSVEIELIGEAQPFMVFQLDEAVRKQLEEEEYDTGTEVHIKYLVLEQGQPMITEIEAK